MGVKERLTLEDATAPTLIACEHRHRYRLASSLLEGRRILDLCCGSGYGSAMLVERARSVHGVDVDATTIDAAAATVGREAPVSFEVADALEFLRRPDTQTRFDAIVCFEGLEHLPNPDGTLSRLRELAESGMKMILSVPNSKGLGEENEFHLTDFSWEDALEKLGSFPRAQVLTQYLAEGSLLCTAEPSGQELEPIVALDERREPEYANHYIVCVGVSSPGLQGLMQLEAAPLANRYVKNLERANAELRRSNQRLTRTHLSKADSAAGALVGKYESAARQLEELLERHAALEREHSAWVDRCHGAEAREEALREKLAQAEARLDSLVVQAVARVVVRDHKR